jgi:hypothetical protein
MTAPWALPVLVGLLFRLRKGLSATFALQLSVLSYISIRRVKLCNNA